VADGNLPAAAETANALGRVYLESGQTPAAVKWYRTGFETVRRQRDVPGPQLDLAEMRWLHAQARVAARRGRFVEARKDLAALKALIDKGGTNAEQLPIYWYLMGYIDFYAGRYDTAVRALANADQHDPFILQLTAQAYERKGRTQAAADLYRRILTITSHTLQNAFARPIARQKVAAQKSP
jgi:tetratricopeptide (TPR) repeat protein